MEGRCSLHTPGGARLTNSVGAASANAGRSVRRRVSCIVSDCEMGPENVVGLPRNKSDKQQIKDSLYLHVSLSSPALLGTQPTTHSMTLTPPPSTLISLFHDTLNDKRSITPRSSPLSNPSHTHSRSKAAFDHNSHLSFPIRPTPRRIELFTQRLDSRLETCLNLSLVVHQLQHHTYNAESGAQRQ